MSFSIFDLFLVVIFSQGLFLSITIQLMPNKNRAANNMLTIILLLASILVLGRVLLLKYNTYLLWTMASFLDVSIFLFGPLLYSYIRRLIFHEKKTFSLNKIHYLLPILHVLFSIWTQRFSKSEYIELLQADKFYIQFLIIELLGIISVVFYLVKSFELTLKFNKSEINQLSYHQKIANYIKSLLVVISIFVLLWGASFIHSYILRSYNIYFNYQSMWASMSLLMYFIGFFSLTQPSIFRILIIEPESKINKNKNRLTSKEIEILKDRINDQVVKNKIYQKHDLNLLYLSNLVKTTPNNLSWLLNNIYNKSFYEYINEYRIKDFIQKIENKQHENHTLIAIAEDVGFNSKSTFNKSFKAIMNNTPSNYIKNLKT